MTTPNELRKREDLPPVEPGPPGDRGKPDEVPPVDPGPPDDPGKPPGVPPVDRPGRPVKPERPHGGEV